MENLAAYIATPNAANEKFVTDSSLLLCVSYLIGED